MSLFKRLCSAFTSSVDEAISELSERANNAINNNKVEPNPPTVEKSTYTPECNSGVISPFLCDGGIKSGTTITVSDGQFLVALKDGNIVELLPTGMYVVNEESASKLASSNLYYISLKESDIIRWGTTKPICFTDNKYGELSLRICGNYSYKITDVVKFVTDYMITGNSLSVNDYTKNLLINAVEKAIYNCNGSSYTELSKVLNKNLIEDELRDTGIYFAVNFDMISLTEESQAKINQAINNM